MQSINKRNYLVQNRAALAIQAAYRGYITRKFTLLPGDLKHLYQDPKVFTTICREANRYLQETRFVESKPPKTIKACEKHHVPSFYIKWVGVALYLVFHDEKGKDIANGVK